MKRITAPRLVHQLTGEPPVEGAAAKQFKEETAICCMCGNTETLTANANRVLGTNFTERQMFHAPESQQVCWACTAICSGAPPKTFRMWSIVATPGLKLAPSQEKAATWLGQHKGICVTNRANTEPIIDLLLNPPTTEWMISLAVSGQKHVIPYAHVNTGPTGVIRMEAVDVGYTQQTFTYVFTHALALRRLGIPAEPVLQGIPKYLKTREQLDAWHIHNTALKPYLGSPLLQLILWVLTKGVIENDKKYPNA